MSAASGANEDATSRANRKAQSRRRILDSARDVFFRDGFMAANLDEVADRAGVAKGTLYRYFDSKADLYVAVLAENSKAFLEKMSEAGAQGSSALEKLRALSAFYLDHWRQHKNYFQIFWAIDNQAVIGQLPPGVIEQVSKLWEDSLSIVDDVLRQGVRSGEFIECDTWLMANILWTEANAMIQSDQTEERRKLRRSSLEDVYQTAVDLTLAGLMRRHN